MRLGSVFGIAVLAAACGGRVESGAGAAGASSGSGGSGATSGGGGSGASGGSVSSGGAGGGSVGTGGASGTVGTGGTGGLPSSRCAELCATPTPPGCPFETPPDEREQCTRDCESFVDEIAPECWYLWEELAGCVEKRFLSCEDPQSCERLAEEITACGGGPSCGQGVGWASSEGSAEVTYGACGCGDPGGVAPGGPCNGASECAEMCCGCDGRQEFGVRMCRRGQCAGARACDAAREMVPDVCF